MTSGARMLLHYCDGGVTTSWEKAPRERGRPARTNLGIASPISSTRIERQRRHGSASAGPRRFPPAGGAGCGIAGKLSGNPRDSMRARRPRSRGVLSRWCAGGYPAGDFSENRPAPFGKLPFVREPCPRRAVRIKPECNNQKSTIPSRPWYPVAVNLNALVALRRSSVESRTGALTIGSGGVSVAFASGLSPAPLSRFQSPLSEPDVRFSRISALQWDHASRTQVPGRIRGRLLRD